MVAFPIIPSEAYSVKVFGINYYVFANNASAAIALILESLI